MDGYIHAVHDLNVGMIEDPPFHAFHDWVAMKYGHYESTSGWNNMILNGEGGDEEKALESFFTQVDEFKKRKAKVILQAVPEFDGAWRHQIVDLANDERIPLENPTIVQIIKYTEDKGVFIRYLRDNVEIDREEYCKDLEIAFIRTQTFVKNEKWKTPEA